MAPKLLIVTGLALTAAANLFIGLLPPYIWILVLWCVNAFGQSMLWSALLKTMTGIYGKAQADKKVPILVSSVSAGNILGILFSTQLVSLFGIRAAFLVPGVMTAIMGALAAAPTEKARLTSKRPPFGQCHSVKNVILRRQRRRRISCT